MPQSHKAPTTPASVLPQHGISVDPSSKDKSLVNTLLDAWEEEEREIVDESMHAEAENPLEKRHLSTLSTRNDPSASSFSNQSLSVGSTTLCEEMTFSSASLDAFHISGHGICCMPSVLRIIPTRISKSTPFYVKRHSKRVRRWI